MRDVSLLWALRSPCNLGCRYCYFGTIDEHRVAAPTGPGQLSHLSRGDLNLADITGFLSTIAYSSVRRVFLAGGEPLIWPAIMDVIAALVEADVEVTVCTNGIPLQRTEITTALVDLGVHAVSVSLDHTDADYNDTYRPARNGKQGWHDVVAGIDQLMQARGRRLNPRVGIYSVITHRNIDAVQAVAAFAVRRGLDYFVPQPIALAPDHPLQEDLGLRPDDIPDLAQAMSGLYAADLPINLPAPTYARQLVDTIAATHTTVHECFAGDTLFFIEPDGSVWDCPSSDKIAATPAWRHRSIRGSDAATTFARERPRARHTCTLASRDCVNMWPLMGFDRLGRPPRRTGEPR